MQVPLYGRVGITEIWVVDLESEVVDAARTPGPQGYGDVRPAGRGESLEIAGATVGVDEILG